MKHEAPRTLQYPQDIYRQIPWVWLLQIPNWRRRQVFNGSNCITNFNLFGIFNSRNDVANIARFNFLGWELLNEVDANLIRIVLLSGRTWILPLSFLNRAIYNFINGLNTSERVKVTVKNQCLKRTVWISFRRWNTLDDSIKISGTPCPVFAEQCSISSRSQPIKSMIWSPISSGFAEGRSILLRIGIISRSCSRPNTDLRWSALEFLERHLQSRVLLHKPRLIAKLHRRNPRVQGYQLDWWCTFLRFFLVHLNGVRLNRNTALPFQVHVVQKLVLLFTITNCGGKVQQAIGQVDLPWSMWAMIQKLRMFFIGC